jgi:uncharacterized caspase-like protein
MAKYVPIKLELIDEGLFSKQIEIDFGEVQRALINYIAHNGKRIQKGSAKLVIELTVGAAKPKNSDVFSYYVEAKTKKQLPATPPSVSVVLLDLNDDNEDTLFVSSSGGRRDTPLQQVLCTSDGRTVDQETGEVLDKQPGTEIVI